MLKAHRTIARLLWFLTIGWLLIAWFLSSQTGDETGKLSMAMSAFISRIFGLEENAIPLINAGIRTVAHIVVYFVLTGLATASTLLSFSNRRHAWLWPLLPCAVLAVIDEIRKATIPGRHCSWSEAGLNVLGCVLGVMAVWGIMAIVRLNGKKGQ